MSKVEVVFESLSENEGFARVCAAAFVARLDPTLEEINDIKTVVSEAVTNSIIHGYSNKKNGKIQMNMAIEDNRFYIEITDYGIGILDIEKAMEPMYTTKPEEERSGMGFSFMEAFMNELEVESKVGEGTTIKMMKIIGEEKQND